LGSELILTDVSLMGHFDLGKRGRVFDSSALHGFSEPAAGKFTGLSMRRSVAQSGNVVTKWRHNAILHFLLVGTSVDTYTEADPDPDSDTETLKTLTMSLTPEQRGRITARVPQNVQDTLQQAADLQGATLNQFVVQAALTEARRVIERDRVIQLSSDDAAFLLDLLEKPPAPNARLKKAFQNYKKRALDAEHSTFDWPPRPKHVR
jgi:uncharacterized protein (DUF1778 family)